jgi:glutaredoxin
MAKGASRPDPMVAALAVAGLVVSGYLAWLKWSGAPAVFCTVGTGCDIVQSSRYATFLGVPTASERPVAIATLGVGAALVAIVAGIFVFAGGPPPATPYQQALARHLARSGATFYGAYWCPHCQEQKELFGGAAGSLPYVECDAKGANAQTERCERAGVRAFPTWVIGGERREGMQSLEELARVSGFK